MKRWKCDYCGVSSKDEADDCRKCGAPRSEGEYEPAPSPYDTVPWIPTNSFTCTTYRTITTANTAVVGPVTTDPVLIFSD